MIIPLIDTFRARWIARTGVDFPPQPVITKDNVTMMIDTVVTAGYRCVKFVYEIANPILAIENLTATTEKYCG